MFCLSLFFSGESSPRPVFRWLENGKPRDANRTEFSRGKMGGEKITSIVELRAGPKQTDTDKCFHCALDGLTTR